MEQNITDGLEIRIDQDELVLKGSKQDLLELADYIRNVAESPKKQDHIHLDNLTLISKRSNIKNLIVEKEEK